MTDRQPAQPTDEQLMRLIVKEDPDALAILINRHGGTAFSLALRIIKDRGRAAETTQEAFLACWRGGGAYRSTRGTVRSWLLAIVRNRSIDAVRYEHSRPQLVESGLIFNDEPSADHVEAQVLANEVQREMRVQLDLLPAEQLCVIDLAYFQGFSHAEIAERLCLPLGTVKGRIRLAHKRLLDGLGPDACPTAT
jgi:RNA polymerase sigma-70 factor (ECF subfamily)